MPVTSLLTIGMGARVKESNIAGRLLIYMGVIMKKVKFRIFSKVFILIIVSFFVISIVFNVAVKKYVNKKTVEQINAQINMMKKEYTANTDVYYADDFFLFPYDYVQTNVVPINIIIVDKQYNINGLKYYWNRNDMGKIVQYYSSKRFLLEEGKCIKIKINGRDYYTASTKIFLGYLEETEDVSATEREALEGTVILAANISPLTDFVERINTIFLIIVVAAGLIICLAGYRIGVNIEKDRQNLNYLFQNVSHELKTPIMSIQGYAEGIETGVMKDHVRAAGIILSESENMRGMIEEILFLSKINTGKLKKVKEELNICELLYYCMGRVEQEAAKKNINLEADFAEDIPMYIGDEVQLEKVFTNLLFNAIRYAKTKIKISCTIEKKYIKIVVADDGNGIDESDFPYIFERFYKGKNGNTGIGLSIAKEVVKMHKGTIEAKNNNGANFIIKLKL